jgi:uncharacterized protein
VRKHRIEDERLESEEFGAFEDVEGAVTLMRTDRTVMVTGSLTARTAQTCSRCLDGADLILTADLEEEYHPVNTDLGGVQRKTSPGDDEPLDPVLWIDDRNNLDLSGAVLQSFEGMMPIAPLCRPDCKGLCPVCSKDRNKSTCDCQERTEDSRWRGLASLGSFGANSPG